MIKCMDVDEVMETKDVHDLVNDVRMEDDEISEARMRI